MSAIVETFNPEDGLCRCGKIGYPSRLEARRAITRKSRAPSHSGGRMSVYQCPSNSTIFHLGHRKHRHAKSRKDRGLSRAQP